MVANGTNGPKSLAQLLAEFETDKRRDQDAEARAHREALEAELAAVNAKLALLTAPPPLVRSQMSARAKSDYITEHGKPAYDALPWA